jgi:hypothetical protein
MHRRTLAAAAALALLAPGAAQAQAQAPEQVTYYFHCAGPGKVQNGSAVLAQQNWNTTKPTASFQSGAGCGFLDAPGPVRPSTIASNAYDAYFSGLHGGAIETVRLELHNLVTSRARQGDTITFNVRIWDASAVGVTPLADRDFTVKPVASSTGATEMVQVEWSKLKIKAGPEDRRLWISVHTEEAPQGWVFDASEIPANVTFVAPPPPPAA